MLNAIDKLYMNLRVFPVPKFVVLVHIPGHCWVLLSKNKEVIYIQDNEVVYITLTTI